MEPASSCAIWHEVAPSLGAIVISLGFSAWMHWKQALKGSFDLAFSLMFLLEFIQFAINTSVIVDAYDVSKYLDQSASFSGLLISTFMIGFLVAASSLSLLMMRYTELWCKFPKILFLIALICSLCGSFLYVVTLAILPSFAEPQELAWLILLSRFLGGFGAGISEKTGQVAISKSTLSIWSGFSLPAC